MFFPWMFTFLLLGLISGGGIAILQAPTDWVTRGLDAPQIMEALQCVTSTM